MTTDTSTATAPEQARIVEQKISLFATAYDGDWDAYIDDFASKIPDFLDIIDSETRRLRRIGQAVDQFLDTIGD